MTHPRQPQKPLKIRARDAKRLPNAARDEAKPVPQQPDPAGKPRSRARFNNNLQAVVSKTGAGFMDIYSFEVKKVLKLGDIRSTFFETLGNSSWANYRYVVAADIDEAALKEFKELARQFATGLIRLVTSRTDKDVLEFTSKSNIIVECPRRPLDLRAIDYFYNERKWKAFKDWMDRIP